MKLISLITGGDTLIKFSSQPLFNTLMVKDVLAEGV